MNYILDTNVISEFSKRRPNPAVTQLLLSMSRDRVWLSVMTLGEIRRGIEDENGKNPNAARSIMRWLAATESDFAGRILPVTAEIAHRWGEMSAGRTRPVVDTLIAATASIHNLTVVTRNERDYRDLDVPIINPWA